MRISQIWSRVGIFIFIPCLIATVANAAPNKKFVTEKKLSALSTAQISFKIKRPKAPKGASLNDGLRINGCWLADGFKSLKAVDAAKRPVKFKKSKDGSALELKKIAAVKFPINVVLTFNETRPVLPLASSVIALGKTKCELVKTKSGDTKEDCSASQSVSLRSSFSGVFCNNPSDFIEQLSDATVVFADGDEFTIRSRTAPLRFAMQDGSFLSDLTDFTVTVNDDVYDGSTLQLVDGILTVTAPLKDGLNFATVIALDSEANQTTHTFSFWAGSNTLNVLLQDTSGQPVQNGEVSLFIGDNKEIKINASFTNGQASFSNIPGATIAISALSTDGRTGFAAAAGDDGTVVVKMLPLLGESAVANNDVSLGTDGWEIEGSNVTVTEHTEDEPATLPATSGPIALPQQGPDQDLVLHTTGEGVRFMSRTFRTDPKSRLVRIRYRFQTSEYPGGYFGSKYNDFYNVSLRSSAGASIVDDGSSMNALGRAAFSPQGYTVWKSTVIPVNRNKGSSQQQGEVVQAAVAVANVADGAYDSRVIVDKIEESPFAITEVTLNDIDNTPLKYLSTDSHSYFQGFTYINGTITLEGESNDSVQKVELKLMNGASTLKTAAFSTQAASKIIGKKFGKTRKLQIKNPILLFKLFPKDAADLDSADDRDFSLVVRAESKNGTVAESTIGSVKSLVRFKGSSRYDGRDDSLGGDDWVLPSIRKIVDEMGGLTFGDFSNMNGGNFSPHDTHREGRSVDAWLPGYNALDAGTAQSLIDLLNSPQGSRVRFIYVRFNRNPGNKFYQAISGRTLNNGRSVRNVILPDAAHGTHFHMEF